MINTIIPHLAAKMQPQKKFLSGWNPMITVEK